MTFDLQDAVERLIAVASAQRAKIETLERDLARAFQEIEALRASTVRSKERGCIAKEFGGEWCIGKCRDPRDCSASPHPSKHLGGADAE